jgi:hypothetical protein
MTKRMTQIVRALLEGKRLRPPQMLWSRKWTLEACPLNVTREWVNGDTIERMKNLGFLSYRDEAGNHLGTLKPTPKALEELTK